MTAQIESGAPISNWKLYLEILSKQPSITKSLWWLIPLLLVYVGLVVTEPYFYKLFVDGLAVAVGKPELLEETTAYFIKVSIGWAAFVIFSIATFTLYDFSLNTLANADWKNFSIRASGKMLRLPIDYHISTNLGEKQKILDRGIATVWDVAYETYLVILPQVLVFIFLLAFGFYFNPLMMVISLFVLPIGAIVSVTVGKKAHTLQKKANDLWDKIYGRFGDELTNIGIIRLYTREKHEGSIVGKLIDNASNEQFKIRKLWCFLNAGGKSLEFIGKIGVTIA